MSGTGTIIPLKIFFPARGYQIGVAAKSLQHLRDTLQAKMGLSNKFKLTLDDGTIVCDPEYFKLLERQTKLNVIESSPVSKTTTNEVSVDAARKRTSPSAPAAANKRARLSPEGQRDKTDLNTNQNNSQLLSKICISSVAGNVPMSESPKHASERPRLSTAVQQQKQLRSTPQPQVQHNPPQCIQNIQSPPAQSQQVKTVSASLQHVHQTPAGKTVAAQRPGSIIMVPPHPTRLPHPQIQQSIPPGSALIHPSLQLRPQGPPFPQQIVIPSNQPNAFPGHPHTPLSAPPMMTPPPIQWIRHGYPPYGNVIHPQSQHCPPGGVLYPHQVQVPPQQMPIYQPRPPPPPPQQQQQLTQERIYQMQVEQQMKTTIRMTPPPNPLQSQMPLSPQPVQPQIRPIALAQTQPVAVIRSPVGPKPSVYQQAQPAATLMPDGEHIVRQVVELLQAPEPTMIPSTPPALLKVVCSKPPMQSRHAPTPDLSNSAGVSGLSTPTPVSDSESTNLQGTQVAPEDTDSEDEHALQIVVAVGESENLPPSTPPPPSALSSPQSQASSSPSRSPVVVDTALNAQKPHKPTELNLLASQIDDGYCSATASSLGSADDVKRALPFASFDEYIPLHNCYAENKEDPQENHAIVPIISQDKCTVTNPKGNSTLSNEHEQDTASPAPSAITNECLDHATDERVQHTATDQTQSAITSEDLDNESLVIEFPIKVIDGQIYYDDHVSDKIQIKEEPDAARQEVIFIDSELEDCDSDVNMFEHFINQGTPNSFHLSLDDDEVSEVDTDLDICKSVENKGDIDEEVVVEEHGAEVPVVTTPLDYSVAFDLNKCVADIISVVNSKDKDVQNSNSPRSSKATDQIPNNTSTPLGTCLGTNASSTGITRHYDGEAVVEESVLIDSSNLHEEGVLSDELAMGNEVVLSLEGSSQQLDYVDTSELISNLLLHSCLPQNGGRVSLS